MIYCKTINVERIAVHPMDDVNNTQFIELTKYGDEPVFSVDVCDGEFQYFWEFDMSEPSDYERVKLCIFDMICNCNTMEELVYTLDVIFRDWFEEILIEDRYECCADCDGYGYLQ